MQTKKPLPGSFRIEPHYVRAILSEYAADRLIQLCFIPCTLDQLNQFDGIYARKLQYLFNNGYYLDSDEEDFICQPPRNQRIDLINETEMDAREAAFLPNEIRWIREADESRISVVLNHATDDFYFNENYRMMKRIHVDLQTGHTLIKNYLYDRVTGQDTGWYQYSPTDTKGYYHAKLPDLALPFCDSQVFQSAWAQKVGNEVHYLTLEEVEDKLLSDDFIRRQTLRVSEGILEGDFIVTSHTSDLLSLDLYGEQLQLWSYINDQIYMTQTINDENRKPRYTPLTTSFYDIDDSGRVVAIRYGGGTLMNFMYEFDTKEHLTHFEARHEVIDNTAIPSAGRKVYLKRKDVCSGTQRKTA